MTQEITDIGIVDVETTPLTPGYIPQTKFWGAATEKRGYGRYKDFASLAKFMAKNPHIRWYFHHDYEITQLLVEGFTPHSMRSRGSRIIRANVANSQWINSFALFPSPLSEILEACGFEKKPLTSGHETGCDGHECECLGKHPLHCVCPACGQAISERNYSDCMEALIAIRRISNSYAKAFGIDPIREGYATQASCTFAASEKIAGPLPVFLGWPDAYRGGRVEPFRLGNWDAWGKEIPFGRAESWDINSSYPHAFTDAPHTDTLIRARVKVKTTGASPFFHYIPNEEPKKRSFMFPQGVYETLFFESNYERYIRPNAAGVVLDIKPLERVKVDLTWIRRVSSLMRHAYALRAHAKEIGDAPLAYGLKIGMNAAYGRIGMKAEREFCAIKDTLPPDCSYYELPNGRNLVFQTKYLPHTTANYLLAAWITDNARARLFAGLANCVPYYCDTDGIKCEPGTFALPHEETKLGGWKYEGTKPLHVTTVKDYVFGKDVVRKGGETYKRWTVKTVLSKSGVKTVNKTRKTTYDKREIWPGGETRPLEVFEY